MTAIALNNDTNRELVRHLRDSEVFRGYQRAFEKMTRLPLSLLPAGTLNLALHGSHCESPFCALMSAGNSTCAACLSYQARLDEGAHGHANTLTCFAGLCESSVPVFLGQSVIAFLHTGQVLMQAPTRPHFERIARILRKLGATADVPQLEQAYFQTRVLTRAEYVAAQRLLAIFAQHLSMISNQIMVAAQQPDPPAVERAKAFIAEHVDEPLTLTRVGRAVNASAYYFCKLFRRSTGLHFIDYVARVRVERAKNLLLNPQIRISEAAYAAGFQSLSQFNRTFKRVTGEQPRVWREKLAR